MKTVHKHHQENFNVCGFERVMLRTLAPIATVYCDTRQSGAGRKMEKKSCTDQDIFISTPSICRGYVYVFKVMYNV